MALTLYYHPLASYCHKVLIALYEHGVAFDKRLIDLGDPADRAELGAVWPLVKFPVLRDQARGRDVPETSIIIEYLDHYYAGGRAMIPADWDAALEVRLWDRFFDNHVQGPMQAIVAHRLFGGSGTLDKEHAALAAAYHMIERQLAAREWVAGDGFGMADCAAAPALFYAFTLEAPPADAPRLAAYFERLMARPSVRRVIDEARPYFHMYPFKEAIPQRFMEGG
ncbi:MAG: glutathione S-transferase family protein [Massilia sp.]